MNKKRGKLIVIEGSDGSGKATQSKLLFERLTKDGEKIKKIDFPQYEENFFGSFIGECLRGDHGNFLSYDPKIASILYAADRSEASNKYIRGWLEKGFTVLSDRYASANQIHQGGKIKDPEKRAEFMKWLDMLEFGVFKIPRPDILIYLNVPVEVSFSLLQNKNMEAKKKYLKGKKDQHEDNLDFMVNSKKSAEDLLEKNKNWIKIECVKDGNLLSREEIHEEIYSVIKNKL